MQRPLWRPVLFRYFLSLIFPTPHYFHIYSLLLLDSNKGAAEIWFSYPVLPWSPSKFIKHTRAVPSETGKERGVVCIYSHHLSRRPFWATFLRYAEELSKCSFQSTGFYYGCRAVGRFRKGEEPGVE